MASLVLWGPLSVCPTGFTCIPLFFFFFFKKKIVESKVRTVTWQAQNHTKHLILLFGQHKFI
jgi:hypothetical protein